MQPLSKTRLKFYKRKRRIEELARNFNWDFLDIHSDYTDDDQFINESNNNEVCESVSNSISVKDNLACIINEEMEIDNENLLPFEITEYLDDEDDEFKIETNEKNVYAALITLFFRVNITQSDFKLVIEFAQLLTPIKLPKDFDRIMSQVNQKQLSFNKKWFCHYCKIYNTLSNNKQRECVNCNNK